MPSTQVIFGKNESITGNELLHRNCIGGEIVEASIAVGDERLHVTDGEILNIFPHPNSGTSDDHLIHIQLPYGKILIPLDDRITLQLKPQTNRVHAALPDDTRCGPKHQNHDHHNSDDHDDAKRSVSELSAVDFSKICRFFVYGPLRDDNDSSFRSRKQWLMGCKAESGRLYGFRLYKERYEDYPFAVRTGHDTDYVIGRIIEWPQCRNGMFDEMRQIKLELADQIEGYVHSTTIERDVVDVLNEKGQTIRAIAYYQNANIDDGELQFYDEIPERDWLKRDRSRDLSEYNPSAEMLEMLQRMVQSIECAKEVQYVLFTDITNEKHLKL